MNTTLGLSDIGLPECCTSELSVEHTLRIGATLDASIPLRHGDSLPLLWHWAYFTPNATLSDLGEDGHPRLPPGPLSPYPRRMWASGKVVVASRPLTIGTPATRISRIVSMRESVGKEGPLAIVTVQHRYVQSGSDRIVEEQKLVYRATTSPTAKPRGDYIPSVQEGQWFDRYTPDRKQLFRFSSITFNAHRIHYDQQYATTREGYPDLVVHGPLTALLAASSISRSCRRDLVRFEFRAMAPLFVDSQFTLLGNFGQPVAVRIIRNDGIEAMRISAGLA